MRKPDDDDELLRIVASAANEIVDALGLPAPKIPAALNQIIARYARTLRVTTRNVHDAIEDAKEALHSDGMRAAFRPLGEPDEPTDAADSADSAELASESAAPAASAVSGPQLHREQRG